MRRGESPPPWLDKFASQQCFGATFPLFSASLGRYFRRRLAVALVRIPWGGARVVSGEEYEREVEEQGVLDLLPGSVCMLVGILLRLFVKHDCMPVETRRNVRVQDS